jgi:H+-translocating NAD(P) transhydrogenase subunit beta
VTVIDFAIIAVLIFGIYQFNTPAGARRGNLTAAFALLCALIVVWWRIETLHQPAAVVLALLIGGAMGCLVAVRVNMIQIPAMVAFQHGAGGIAAFLTSFVELTRGGEHVTAVGQFSGVLGVIIGAATFSGSMVASAKLAGIVRQTPTIWPRHNMVLSILGIAIVVIGIVAATATGAAVFYGSLAVIALAMALGFVFAMRVGGADMPVLISFLNATAGLAASFCGVIIQNSLLVACGATVAASGSILTHVMCQAMNRNLLRVFVPTDMKPAATAGGAPAGAATPQPAPAVAAPAAPPRETLLARAVDAARHAQKVIIIPGYGMALAHAQFEVVKLANRLCKMGKDVKFAIHPIAGRMPGHMHVLLAEADADSDLLFDLKEINAEFPATDLVLIVGACDVVNPAAIAVAGTPISGMPILAAHEAKQVIVCNLDDRPGYSGVPNPLYTSPQTILLLGDAQASLSELLQAMG